MTRKSFSTLALLVGSTVFTSPALADVSAADVWANWQSSITELGLNFTADESQDGGVLSVSNATFNVDIPEEDATVTITIPDMQFVERGDGTVEIVYNAEANYVANIDGADGSDVMINIGVENEGLSVIASGTPEAVTYGYTLSEATYYLEDLTVDGESISEVEGDLSFEITIVGMSGQSTLSTGGAIVMEGSSQVEEIIYEVIFVDPDSDSRFVATGLTEDSRSNAAISLPKGMNLEDPYSIFNQDLALKLNASQGWTESVASGSENGEAFSMQTTQAAATAAIEFNQDVFAMDVVASDYTFNMAGGEVPLPVSGQIGELGMNLEVPLSASETPRQFAMGMTMADLAVPDILWNLFDPAAVLDRSPATVDLDITGSLRLLLSAFDPAMADAEDFPGELISMDLNALQVDVAGASLTGSGGFTFDNDDLETFDGFPRPIGAADFKLTGGNALLDGLIQMGLVGDDEAMGARMMMGIFTVAGPGEDELNSRLEVTEDGQVIANGQRLR